MTVPLDADDDGPELAVESETPETILMERSSQELVRGAMDQLPVNYRRSSCFAKWKKCRIRKLRRRFPFR